MATRVPKTGASGGHEFTQGSQPLHVAELDADLDALFDNGITDGNVAPGAGIATSKLASDQGIIAGMLSSNAVTTPKITDLNVTNSKLANLAVTTPKIAIGATVNTTAGASFPANFSTSGTSETTFLTLPFGPRGGRVLAFGTLSGSVVMAGAGPFTIRLRRDGTLVRAWSFNIQQAGTWAITFPVLVDDFPSAVAHTYTVTAQSPPPFASNALITDATDPGSLTLFEFA